MNRRAAVLILIACLAFSLTCIIYPLYVIQPFRAQGAHELAAALLVLRYKLAAATLSAFAALAALVFYWRAQNRWWRRAVATAGALLVCALAALSRVNVYELMFHPDAHPVFRAASQVKLDSDEKVIAVRLGEAARAYPIRIVSYHHVINDVLDKVALVATY